jgi:hypothetical protein
MSTEQFDSPLIRITSKLRPPYLAFLAYRAQFLDD